MEADELLGFTSTSTSSSLAATLHSEDMMTDIDDVADDDDKQQQLRRPLSRNKPVIYLTVLSAIGGFLFGYDTGVVSGAMLLVEKDPRINLSTIWKELIVSGTVAAACLSSLVAGPMADRFGRKPTILLASVIFTGGAIVMGVALNKEILLVGRVIVGISIGLASVSIPIYISESAPSDVRGFLVTFNNIVITFGQLVAALVCGAFSKITPNGWKYMLGFGALPAVAQFLGFMSMPESPRWLLSQGKTEEAVRVLDQLRRGDDYNLEQELEEVQLCIAHNHGNDEGAIQIFTKILKSPSTRRALALGCLLQLFQQVSGINTVMYYSAKIITMAGFSDRSQAIWISAGVACVNFVCTFVGLFLVDKIGRRKLVLISLTGVSLSLALLGLGFHLTNTVDVPDVDIVESVGGALCDVYSDCGVCTSDPSCGFCYCFPPSGSNLLSVNASCVVVSSVNDEFSNFGRCTEDPSSAPTGCHQSEPPIFAYDYCPSHFAWIVILGLCSYLIFFAPGMGPMPWTINSEIYPMWARGVAVSLATSINWMSNLLISMTFLSLTEAITKQGTFYLYAGVAFLGLLIFWWILPETKGKSLEDMEKLFEEPLRSPGCC